MSGNTTPNTTPPATNIAGFNGEVAARAALDSRFECPICLTCLRDPVLTSCGHRFCKECINMWLQRQGGRCPIDSRQLSAEDLFPDNFTRREIMQPSSHCPYNALGCNAILSVLELENHTANCTYQLQNFPSNTECCQWCGMVLPPTDLQNHLEEDCGKVPVSCSFREVGCRATVPRSELAAHMETQIHDHLNLLSTAYNKLSMTVKEQSKDLIDFKSQEAVQGWEAPPKATVSKEEPPNLSQETSCPELLHSVCARLVALEQRSREQEIQIQNVQARFGPLRQEMLLCSGHYVWKVTEFSKQLKAMEAACPTLKVLYSPGFYTSPFGYKFCVRLNLSPGNGQYLSLLVHIMKGEHDTALDWPFTGDISLVAVNQTGGRHLAETMEARSELAAFQRPARDINPRAFGYSEFIQVQDLSAQGFLKDDTIIIRIHVRSNPAFFP